MQMGSIAFLLRDTLEAAPPHPELFVWQVFSMLEKSDLEHEY